MQKSLRVSSGSFFEYGGEGGIDSARCASPFGRMSASGPAVQAVNRLSNPGRGFSSLPGQARYKCKKARTCVQALSLNMAVREGLIRPAGPHHSGGMSASGPAVQAVNRLSNPGRGFSSLPGQARYKCKKARTCVQALSLNMAVREGFEPSIRCRIHTFQACSFSHSDTSPYCLAASRSGATGRYYRDLHENGQADFFLSYSFG